MEQMFFNRFPTKERLLENFKPQNWWRFIGNEEECVKAPTVALGRIDQLYASQGLAVSVVKSQIMGIYTMSAPNGNTPNEQAIDMTASMFVASNRGCGIYEAMLYFAGYQGSYKSKRSYMAFDTGDILSAFKATFIPHWQDLQGKYDSSRYQQEAQEKKKAGKLVGLPELKAYVTESVEKFGGGEKGIEAFEAQSGMFKMGMLSDERIRAFVRESNEAF